MSKKSCANWKALKRSGKWNIAVPLRPLEAPKIPRCGRELSYLWKVSIVKLLVERGRKGTPLRNSRMGGRLESVGTEASGETDQERLLARCQKESQMETQGSWGGRGGGGSGRWVVVVLVPRQLFSSWGGSWGTAFLDPLFF